MAGRPPRRAVPTRRQGRRGRWPRPRGGTPLAPIAAVTGSPTFPRLKLIDPTGRWRSPADRAQVRTDGGTAAAGDIAPEADLHADFTGDTCLRTNLVTKRLLDAAEPGQVLEIISDNLSSVETIPFMLEGHGCEHLATVHQGDHWRIYARKRQLPPR